MRRWWKTVGVLAGSVLSFGGWLASASAQFPPPGGGMGMPPGGGMGMPPGMGMPGNFGGGPPPGMSAEFPNGAPPSGEPASPFSIKEEGMPNAFTDLVDPRCLRPVRWQVEAGYTMLWYNQGSYPILASTGSVNDAVAGALGQPNTRVLSTTRDPGLSSTFKTTVTYWVHDPQVLGVEGSFFIMEQRSIIQDFSSNQTGSPVLTRPFFNAVTRLEDADPRALPGVLRGTLHDSVTTQFMGAEVNLRYNSANQYQGASFNLIAGARWIRLNETFGTFDTTIAASGAGPSTSISDTFNTRNQFYGGQVGLEWMYRLDRLTFDLYGKFAIGPNTQTVRIDGATTITDATAGTAITARQGLFAQPTNVGTYSSIRTAYVSEFGAKMGLNLTDSLRFNIGYSYLLFNNTVRPGDQIDRNVNVQILRGGAPTPPLVPGAPSFRQSTFNAHMLNLGLEFLF